jgi:hypothetical protein
MSSESQGSATKPGENGSTIYCLVPENRPRLRELLSRHLRDVPGIEVMSERRGKDRRTSEDRRHGAGRPPDGERRRFNPEPERRGKRRRADVELLKPPVPLPPEANRYADEIVFVERRA